MQDSQTNDIDVKIAENKNKIKELNEEIKRLQIEKAKSNNQYVGRCFQMEDGEYILVTGLGWDDNKPYGTSFEFFEFSNDIYNGVNFDEYKIKKEITIDELRHLLNENIRFDRIIEMLGYK